MGKVYLDYAATAPLNHDFKDALSFLANNYLNPSSNYGYELKKEIELTRKLIAEMLNVSPDEIYFTSGASEANAMAIDGFIKTYKDYYKIVSSNIEHSSILNNPHIYKYIECDKDGIICAEKCNYYNSLYCIMHVNNEIGTIQPIKEIAKQVHSVNSYLMCDITQSFGKMEIDLRDIGVDIATASAHKIGGLKGVGFIYIRKGINISPIVYGTQEDSVRGGTYNYLGIKSLMYAIASEYFRPEWNYVKELTEYLMNHLLSDDIVLNGSRNNRIYNNINICIKDLKISSEQFAYLLEEHGFLVSTGSACHSHDSKPSHVLKAIGLSDEEAAHSIRITLGKENTYEEIDEFIKVFKMIYAMNR